VRILLLEDDAPLGAAVKAGLEQEFYAVDWVVTCESAQAAAKTQNYDAIILDLSLPDGDGMDILRQLRRGGILTPVIILTARDRIESRIGGLDSGADDYLIKPFDLNELSARLRAIKRRSGQAIPPLLSSHGLVLDPASLRASQDGRPVILGPKEFRILQKLIEKSGQIVSKETLEDTLYSWGHEVESNAIEVHMHRIRKKLGRAIIRTARGSGYIIEKDR
jgi:DNA-binding response OmpR family regulator